MIFVPFLSENFAKSEHYRLALEQLNRNSSAMASLGAPPLKIHNIHLSDRHNRIDHSSAQVSITNKHSSMYMRNTGFTTGQKYINHHIYINFSWRSRLPGQRLEVISTQLPPETQSWTGTMISTFSINKHIFVTYIIYIIIILTSFVNRWHLRQVFLKLREGEIIEIFNETESEE